MMKFALMGIVSRTNPDWGRERAILRICERARRLGLDGIDWLGDGGVDSKDIRRMADDFGFPAACYTPSVDLNFPTDKERQPGLEAVQRAAETAAILGSDKIMLPMGGKPGLTSQESRRNVIPGLTEAFRIAASFKLMLTVEHFGDPHAPFRVSADVNEAVTAVPGLKITYDSGNVWLGGENASDGFARSRENIVHVHFKDWELADGEKGVPGKDGREYRMTAIGRGLVDHAEVLKALRQSRYDGFVDLEYFGRQYDFDAVVAESRDYLRAMLARM